MPNEKNADSDKAKSQADSVPERTTFGLSLLLILTLFGFLGWQAFRSARADSPDAAPKVTAVLSPNVAQRLDESHWSVPLTVVNTGNVALEEVQVRVSYRAKNGDRENTDFSFAYLAEGATEKAFAVINTAPDAAKPEAHVTAFKTQRQARGY